MKRRAFRVTSALAVSLFAGGPSLANDSTANYAAGGLVLGKTDAIEMRSEDLFVSQERIEVTYAFLNTSKKDVTTTVAFPMPDIRVDPFMGDYSLPGENPSDPFAFKTIVDGKPVAMKLEQKVFSRGEDVTATMKRLKLPFPPQTEKARAMLDALPDDAKAELVAAEIAVEEQYDEGKGMEKHLSPNWTWKATYHWTQTFPAGKPVKIEHRYTPSVGGSVGTSLGMNIPDDTYAAEQIKTYCVDDNLMKTLVKRTKGVGEGQIAFSEARVDYILVTGANWAKPIGDFRLVVDKGSAKNLVSFCAEGVKKIAPTQFEVRKTNFTPKEDLHVLILIPTG